MIRLGKNVSLVTTTVFVVASLGLSACTENPGKTTAIGAATGGAIGATLGAIVGNQTGSTGGGLAIGAIAGASAGGLVGSALEAQEQKINSQDELIVRQRKAIDAQQAKLQELRRVQGDNRTVVASRSVEQPTTRSYPAHFSDSAGVPVRRMGPATTSPQPSRGIGSSGAARGRLHESDIIVPSASAAAQQAVDATRGALDAREEVSAPSAEPVKHSEAVEAVPHARLGAIDASASTSSECIAAAEEISKAAKASDSTDKLFHYRRALRLCPSNPSYHEQLGKLYMTLSRKTDAQYEFEQALALDPELSSAKSALQSLSGLKGSVDSHNE